MNLKVIAHIRTDFPQKFGIPRQSGLIGDLAGQILFEPDFRGPDAVRGIEGFDYLWLLWKFEGTERTHPAATVKPPRLGGKETRGVFATRSPFRPNPIGLSSVRLERIEFSDRFGPILHVLGADLRDHTPIFDIKPYLPYTDSHPNARAGFSEAVMENTLQVVFPDHLIALLPENKRTAALHILEQDPRPAYHNDDRRYGVAFAGFDIRFTVTNGLLTVCEVVKQ